MNETASQPELARSHLWELLGTLLRAPLSQDHLTGLTQLPEWQGELAPAFSRLKQAALAAELTALTREFHRLFIGVGRGELLPYASFYLKGSLMDEPLRDLRQDLQNLGFRRRAEIHEPEDHITALTEVMAMLIRDQHTDEARFFHQHLSPWIPRFFTDLTTLTTQEFYRAVGHLGNTIYQFECRYLSLPAD